MRTAPNGSNNQLDRSKVKIAFVCAYCLFCRRFIRIPYPKFESRNKCCDATMQSQMECGGCTDKAYWGVSNTTIACCYAYCGSALSILAYNIYTF